MTVNNAKKTYFQKFNGWHRPETDSVRSTGQGVWTLATWLFLSLSPLLDAGITRRGCNNCSQTSCFFPNCWDLTLPEDLHLRSNCYKVNLQLQNRKVLGCSLMERQNWPRYWTMFYNPEHYSAIRARLSFQDPMCQDNLTESTGKSGRKFLLSLISAGKAEVTLRMVWSWPSIRLR